jgi:hypothetical protein
MRSSAHSVDNRRHHLSCPTPPNERLLLTCASRRQQRGTFEIAHVKKAILRARFLAARPTLPAIADERASGN